MKEEGGGIKRNGSAAVDQDQVEAGAEVVIRGDGVGAGVGTETVETVINQHMTSMFLCAVSILSDSFWFKSSFSFSSEYRERECERTDSWRMIAPNNTIMVNSLPLHATENEVSLIYYLDFVWFINTRKINN